MIITIKMKPWLKEYLQCRFGNPVQAKNNNIVGICLAPLIEYTPKHHTYEKYIQTESIEIDIPRGLAINALESNSGNIYLSDDNQSRFEHGIYTIFKDEFFFYMNDKIRYEGKHRSSNFKACIYQFCIDNRIKLDSMVYETLKKMYYRYRKSLENNKQNEYRKSPLIFQ